MKFVFTKSHRYWWPVTVRIPDPANAGKLLEQKLRIEFEPKPREKMLEAQERAALLSSLRSLTDHEIAEAKAVIKNWDGVEDEDGNVLPFTPERLEQAMQQSWFRKAVNLALTESMNGEEARLGN